jgi:flagellar assembly factor FliW
MSDRIPTTHGGDITMPVTLQSSRFGEIEISEESVFDFPAGLIGLGGRQFALVAKDAESAFVWLHSLEDPDLAVPVTNPWRFFGDYEVELSDDEASRIGVTRSDGMSVFVTVRAAGAVEDFCANLRAPILMQDGRGHQIINQAAECPVRAPLFAGLRAGAPAPQTQAA